jgi:hypothetical protein
MSVLLKRSLSYSKLRPADLSIDGALHRPAHARGVRCYARKRTIFFTRQPESIATLECAGHKDFLLL